jgi:hypothetical protein
VASSRNLSLDGGNPAHLPVVIGACDRTSVPLQRRVSLVGGCFDHDHGQVVLPCSSSLRAFALVLLAGVHRASARRVGLRRGVDDGLRRICCDGRIPAGQRWRGFRRLHGSSAGWRRKRRGWRNHFAKTLIEALPAGDTIGLIPSALPGAGIDMFRKGVDSSQRDDFTIPPTIIGKAPTTGWSNELVWRKTTAASSRA